MTYMPDHYYLLHLDSLYKVIHTDLLYLYIYIYNRKIDIDEPYTFHISNSFSL